MEKATYEEHININQDKKIELENNNFNFERPYNEGIDWKLKKEMEVLKIFKEYRIIPKSCNKEPITDDEWIEAFENIRLLSSIVNKEDKPERIFTTRLNTLLLGKKIKNVDEAEEIRKKIWNNNICEVYDGF